MEQLILNVISRQVEEKKLPRRSQHGFSKGKSCQISPPGFGDGLSAWAEEGELWLLSALASAELLALSITGTEGEELRWGSGLRTG